MNHARRREVVREQLDALDVDALLVTRMTNVRYLTGFSGTTAFLVLGAEPTIVVDFRYAEQTRREVDVAIHQVQSSREVWPATLALLSKAADARLGVEAATLTLAQHLELVARTGIEPVPTSGLVERVRSIKDADEIEAIREAVLLSDAAFVDLLGIVQAGMTEHRVAGEVERLQRAKGGERSASEIIAASGLRTSLPHGIATDRVLGGNEPLMLDLGTVVRGYLADLTRTVHLGPAPPRFREIYAVVLEAQLAGHRRDPARHDRHRDRRVVPRRHRGRGLRRAVRPLARARHRARRPRDAVVLAARPDARRGRDGHDRRAGHLRAGRRRRPHRGRRRRARRRMRAPHDRAEGADRALTETIAEVAAGVWVGIPGPGEGAMAAVVGGGELVVLDSTSYTVFARRFVEHVATATGVGGPTLLYLSHRHFDHFGGAAAIDAPVVGHRLTREGIARFDDAWIERNVAEWTRRDMVVPELVGEPEARRADHRLRPPPDRARRRD